MGGYLNGGDGPIEPVVVLALKDQHLVVVGLAPILALVCVPQLDPRADVGVDYSGVVRQEYAATRLDRSPIQILEQDIPQSGAVKFDAIHRIHPIRSRIVHEHDVLRIYIVEDQS